MKSRPISPPIPALSLILMAAGITLSCSLGHGDVAASDADLLETASLIHEKAITLDTHVDIPSGERYATADLDPADSGTELRCTLPKMKLGGLDGVFLAVFVGQRWGLDEDGYARAYSAALSEFEAIHRLTDTMHPELCELALRPDDVTRINASGKQAILIGVENGYPLGEDLSRIKEFYALGARYITLSHSGHNQICDSSGPSEPLHGGLSEFGRKVVSEMNRLGIMVDISHVSRNSFRDVLDLARAPVIASHSGCAAIYSHDRNLDDDQLQAVAENGGVVQIVALGAFLKEPSPEREEAVSRLREELGIRRIDREELSRMSDQEQAAYQALRETYISRLKAIDEQFPSATVSDFLDHLDHAVQIAGIDHVGIGTDFDGGGGIQGFNDHSECLNVTIGLLKRGYTAEQIDKIWGGNLLRVWREADRLAAGNL